MSDRVNLPISTESSGSADTVVLDELESKDLVRRAGIRVVETVLARNPQAAVDASAQMGYPVALKVASRDVVHKSDIGAVRLGLANNAEVREAYDGIVAAVLEHNPGARMRGLTVQRMAPSGIELLVGVSQDPSFGPVIMFGLGGTLVEVIGDVTLRVLPIDRRDASAMIDELRGRQILDGYRGRKGADRAELEELLVRVSNLVVNDPSIRELDLNPVMAYRDGNLVLDARAVVTAENAQFRATSSI
jgi:acyl-CoA synthetase (NDP forming)